jgi:alkyl hydroperoxide reductase subunit AhpC
MRSFVSILPLAAFVLASCSSDPAAPADSGTQNPPADSGMTMPTADVPAAPTYPPGPYGSEINQRLRNFTLNTCDGTPWEFARENWENSSMTVIIISAGWCVPCQREAAQIQGQLVEPFRDRNVRVVGVLVQDQNHNAINGMFCNTWVTRYNMQIPMLQDPRFTLQPFVPNAAFPGNVIVDRQGRIRWRQYGTDMSLTAIRAAIEEVLAHPDP